ncbi:MAG TPA: substrate-binding domain-containing protein [Acidimicrobiales bacterium]|jgi:rhamnose transport system substrate-binding protein|nr:substrate-binding domain-containing protein [Acidimicrobiales bacterium]
MKLRKWGIGLAVLALVAAGCGGDDDDDDASTGGDNGGGAASGEVVSITGGDDIDAVLLPKCQGNAVFDQANDGAKEAAEELGTSEAEFVGPATCDDSTGQIEFMTNAAQQGADAVMISNNAGEQIQSGVDAVTDADGTVVAWDSPIPSGEGESLFVAQVDFDETGVVMADMALDILGEEGGEFAILSASPDAANQNAWIDALNTALEDPKYDALDLVDTVYGNDVADESYDQALALVDSNPDLKLIMAPTTVGIAAAGKAMTDEGLCDQVKVSGLGLPDEMKAYTESGCAPEFALWSFVDLGYLTYYATYGIATGQIEATEGQQFEAGRMGEYTIEKDPTRDNGLRVVMGAFTVYDKDNIDG